MSKSAHDAKMEGMGWCDVWAVDCGVNVIRDLPVACFVLGLMSSKIVLLRDSYGVDVLNALDVPVRHGMGSY